MDTVADLIYQGLPAAFMWGFVAGFLMCASVFAIKAVVKLIKRLWR